MPKDTRYYVHCPNCNSKVLVDMDLLKTYPFYQSICTNCDDINKIKIGPDNEIWASTYKKAPHYTEPSMYSNIHIGATVWCRYFINGNSMKTMD